MLLCLLALPLAAGIITPILPLIVVHLWYP